MKTQEKTQDTNTDETQALAIANTNNQMQNTQYNFVDSRFLAEVDAEIQQALKAVSVDKLTSRTELLGKRLNLVDCFTMEFDFGKGEELQIVYVVNDEAGNIFFTTQNINTNAMRFVKIYDNVRTANAAKSENRVLALTNVEFKKLEKGGVGNNKPIILSFTKDTKQIWQ